jgi:hypothetical protein
VQALPPCLGFPLLLWRPAGSFLLLPVLGKHMLYVALALCCFGVGDDEFPKPLQVPTAVRRQGGISSSVVAQLAEEPARYLLLHQGQLLSTRSRCGVLKSYAPSITCCDSIQVIHALQMALLLNLPIVSCCSNSRPLVTDQPVGLNRDMQAVMPWPIWHHLVNDY